MKLFSQVLIEIKLNNGFKTTKSFYNHLKARGLDCNYQHFVKIDSGVVFPSSELVNQIAKVLSKNEAEKLIKTYCSEQFTSFNYLFPISPESMQIESSKEITINQGQKELTLLQVQTLKKKRENYFLFLLMTLSRSPIGLLELRKYPNLHRSINELKKVDIVFEENNTLIATCSEFRFPKLENNAYLQFDQWDIEFSKQFEFKNFLNKMMIRRISPRYFGVILKQIEALTDFIRCSDESDPKYNNDVLHFHLTVDKGNLPG